MCIVIFFHLGHQNTSKSHQQTFFVLYANKFDKIVPNNPQYVYLKNIILKFRTGSEVIQDDLTQVDYQVMDGNISSLYVIFLIGDKV